MNKLMRIEIMNTIKRDKGQIEFANKRIMESENLIKDTNTRYQYLVKHPEKALPKNSQGHTEQRLLLLLAKDLVDIVEYFKSYIKNNKLDIMKQEEILKRYGDDLK